LPLTLRDRRRNEGQGTLCNICKGRAWPPLLHASPEATTFSHWRFSGLLVTYSLCSVPPARHLMCDGRAVCVCVCVCVLLGPHHSLNQWDTGRTLREPALTDCLTQTFVPLLTKALCASLCGLFLIFFPPWLERRWISG
jgi:hypothetical protein